ncbi:MAG: glutamine synthetase III [Bernardetiaceae bacterium]|nr:glutamine synthetase III [Bernardetiaceae bacterium]
MARIRFDALKVAQSRTQIDVTPPAKKISDYYGKSVFGKEAMRSYLASDTYKRLNLAIRRGERIDGQLADAVASALKSWAIEHGATHYTHWFQPLRGTTAEKHDAFFRLDGSGKAIEEFKGTMLVQQEPDASSFPSGGLRNTFEARGYTAWDPTSPAFLLKSGGGITLCIPSVFVAYTGQALDHKTPLLKSVEAINQAATAVCQFFDKNVKRVSATLGAEQEFFLVDKALFNARPDLVLCGRTLFGHSPARGQQLSDHYFGSIPPRVKAFMQAFEMQALQLGIPITTRHNEVAPGQYECAPIFEDMNVAVDHNLLLMDLMTRIANDHNFCVLFHEKPFAGVNGSGKHNNWALATDTGKNLLAPSTKPKDNLQFLTFFVNTIKAVHTHSDLVRASIASDGNDYRLGANEAPPAIISVFIGQQLSAVLDALENNADVSIDKGENMYMKLGLDKIPAILLDNTDRNRTSPFAFTGNKFEVRAVGSSANNATPMTVLNTIVADQLIAFKEEVDARVEKGEKREIAITNVLREYIKTSKDIRFEGNNYSAEWAEEAAKRGLSNIRNTPEALDQYLKPEAIALFERHNILTKPEIEARHEIEMEKYLMQLQIESRVLGDLAMNHAVPNAIKYQQRLIQTVKGMKELGLEEEAKMPLDTIRRISKHVGIITENVREMVKARKKANEFEVREAAEDYCKKVKPYFEIVRKSVDKLEILIDDELWSLPKYRELLFVR